MSHRTIKAVLLSILGSVVAAPLYAEISPVTPEQCANMKANNVISDKNPVGCERLRTVSFSYVNFEGAESSGRVVVLDALAKRVQMIFDTLLKMKFPLHKAVLLENYHGDDDASMSDNNTSAFNGRPVTGGTGWSLHAYGAAIDLNPLQNPFISLNDDKGTATVLPTASAKTAVNRLNYRPKKEVRPGMAEDVIDIFAQNGFISWGGYWNFPIDYQHFEIGSRGFAQQLANLSPDKAADVFERGVAAYSDCMSKTSVQPHEAARAACVAQVIQ